MQNIKIITDSSSDIPMETIKKYDIGTVPFYITLDGQTYLKEHLEITTDEFHKKLMEEKFFPRTSLPSISDYSEVFRKPLEDGMDVLCICLSSKLSGSYQSAVNAGNIMKEDFPDRKIFVVDSMSATIGQGLLALEAVYMREAGLSIEEIVSRLEKLKEPLSIIFTIDTLEYLQKSGRISTAAAFTGNLLNIKPILFIQNGEVIAHSKSRGRKNSVASVIELVKKELDGKIDDYRYGFMSCYPHNECGQLSADLKQLGITSEIPFSNVGVTIGSHTGPSALGVAFIRKFDRVSESEG